jgi:hypothetical protein
VLVRGEQQDTAFDPREHRYVAAAMRWGGEWPSAADVQRREPELWEAAGAAGVPLVVERVGRSPDGPATPEWRLVDPRGGMLDEAGR